MYEQMLPFGFNNTVVEFRDKLSLVGIKGKPDKIQFDHKKRRPESKAHLRVKGTAIHVFMILMIKLINH